MAKAFQEMLERFGLTDKILTFNADNATANDTQTTALDELENSFDKENRVRCFNHTLQLSAKSLLKPFNTALSGSVMRDDNSDDMTAQDVNENESIPDGDDEEEEEGGDEEDLEGEVEDDDIDELQELSEDEQKEMFEETTAVRETITKVCTPSKCSHSRC
jgi:hypothetical protein